MSLDSHLSVLTYKVTHSASHGIHSSLTTTGIPTGRIVFFTSEPGFTNGETFTDNLSVSYDPLAGEIAGVVIDGSTSYATAGLTLLPGFNQDLNVTVMYLGTYPVEAAPGEEITAGRAARVNNQGQLVGSGGTLTNYVTLTTTSGAGTASNPEYVLVLAR